MAHDTSFPSARTYERPMSENAILAALRRMGYTNGEMTGHGFRSTASTLLHEQGWNHQVIERQLAHAERNAVSAAYNFAKHLPESQTEKTKRLTQKTSGSYGSVKFCWKQIGNQIIGSKLRTRQFSIIGECKPA
jgi:integrase